MNTKTIQSADTEIMGTLYIDISEEYLDNVINETKLEEGSRIYIIDKKSINLYMLHKMMQLSIRQKSWKSVWIKWIHNTSI